MSPHRSTKRLGELLIEQGLLTSAQLERALDHQRMTKEFLGVILVRLNLVPAKKLLAILSEQFGMPCESLTPERVDWTVVDQFPSSVLSSENCFPIRADAESVTVAIVNPLDAWALSAIEHAVKFRRVKPILVLQEELANVQQAYRQRSVQRIATQLNSDGHH
jgi:type IV pilus assembly protein PilB